MIARPNEVQGRLTDRTPRVVIGLFLATLLFQLPYFDRWYALLDEGHILMFADIVVRGGEIYRDATIYPLPGAFYLLAWAFEVFGESILVSRWIVVVQFCVFVPLVYLWMRRLVPVPWALTSVAALWAWRIWSFPHWQMYSYSTTALLFLLASMYCLLIYFDRASRSWLYAAGTLFGLGVACKQDYGAALFIAACTALLATTFARSRRVGGEVTHALGGFLIPGALVGALLGGYFLVKGVLPDLVQMTVFNHMRGLASFAYPEIPSLFPLFSQDPGLRDATGFFNYFPGLIFTVDAEGVRNSFLYRETIVPDLLLKLFFYAPYLVALLGGVRLWRRRELARVETERPAYFAEFLLYAFAFGIVLVLTFNKPQDYVHFAVVYWPFLCLAVVYLHSGTRSRPTLAIAIGAVLAVFAIAIGGYGVSLIHELRESNSELVAGARAGIYASPEEGQLLGDIVDYVHARTETDDKVAVIPYFPIVQFLMDRRGPHRSAYIVWPFPEFEDRDERIIAAIEADQTDVVIYNFTQFINFPLMSEFSPALFDYVVDHYRMEKVFSYDYSGYKLAGLRRESAAVRGQAIVRDIRTEGALFVEHGFGPPEPLPPGARDEMLAQERWPFRPVLALRPTVQDGRTVYAVDFDVPASAVLESAVGVNPREWFAHPAYQTTYEVRVVDALGVSRELFRRVLHPHTNFDERGWFEFEISLNRYAGQRIRLLLSTSTQRPEGQSIWGGGFEVPRLVAAVR